MDMLVALGAMFRIIYSWAGSVMPNNKEFLRRNFSETILLNLTSNVFLEYCTKVYGYKIRLGNMLLQNDLDELFEYIELNKPLHVLDFGCGCGELTKKIAADYHIHCTGVEFSEQVVNYLNTINTTANVTYVFDDLDLCNTVVSTYDLILLIDVLYFVDDMKQSLKNIMQLLDRGGKAIVYYSGNTEIRNIFDEIGIHYEYSDISKNEIILWERSMEYANKLKDQFIDEHCEKIYNAIIEEGEFVLKTLKVKGGNRFRYILMGNAA